MNDWVEPKLYCDGGVHVESKNWYLSNGTSNHMTNQHEFFEELDKSVHGHVVLDKGYVMEIKGRRTSAKTENNVCGLRYTLYQIFALTLSVMDSFKRRA
jgi:hypothetical protein